MSAVEKQVRNAAVKVITPGGGHGSGSLVKYKDLTLVITARHVTDGAMGTNYLIVRDGKPVLATLIYASPIHDVAVLYPHGLPANSKPMKFTPTTTYDVGTKIIYSGYPSRHTLMSFDGRISGHEEEQKIGTQIIINTYGWFGCSGSLIYNTKGHVIGILYGVDVEYYPDIQINENMIWVAPIKNLDLKEALKSFCRGTLRNLKACQ